MSEKANAGLTREERLAAKLRENLRRRKVQGRERDAVEGGALFKPEHGG